MKRALACILVLCIVLSSSTVAIASNSAVERASPTLSGYSANLNSYEDGKIVVMYEVSARTSENCTLGIENIEFFDSNGTPVLTVEGTVSNGLIRTGVRSWPGAFEQGLPSRRHYYAEVTVFAKIGSEYDSKTITTAKIFVE